MRAFPLLVAMPVPEVPAGVREGAPTPTSVVPDWPGARGVELCERACAGGVVALVSEGSVPSGDERGTGGVGGLSDWVEGGESSSAVSCVWPHTSATHSTVNACAHVSRAR